MMRWPPQRRQHRRGRSHVRPTITTRAPAARAIADGAIAAVAVGNDDLGHHIAGDGCNRAGYRFCLVQGWNDRRDARPCHCETAKPTKQSRSSWGA